MRSAFFCLALLGTAGGPASAIAEPMSYTHLNVQYFYGESEVDTTPGNIDVDSDGVILAASVGFADHFFIYGTYGDGSLEGPANINKIDTQEIVFGLGGHYGIGDNLDLVARVGYDRAEFDGDFDVESWVLDPTVRLRFLDDFEVEGGIAFLYTTSNDIEDDTVFIFNAEGRWFFVPSAALTLGARIDDEGDAITGTLGLRWTFGP